MKRFQRFTLTKVVPILIVFLVSMSANAQLLSFPTAEGAGKFVSGGRGNVATPPKIYEVTTLVDNSSSANTPGTLRYACTNNSPSVPNRIIVFRVSGTIHLYATLSLNRANTTIAGQTAPGGGITIADYPVYLGANNIVVRYVRFRLGDKNQAASLGNDDCFGNNGSSRLKIMLDHCSLSWSNDEVLSIYSGDSLTIQWCFITEPLDSSYHDEGSGVENHAYGGIQGGIHATLHHNLYAHCKGRMPRFDGRRNAVADTTDFRNNVIYNWSDYTTNGGEGGTYNVVNNYYKHGPNTGSTTVNGVNRRSMLLNPYKSTSAPVLPYGRYYLTGNYCANSTTVTNRNWLGASFSGGSLADSTNSKVTNPFSCVNINMQTAQEAYLAVLQNAGTTLPYRDTMDERIANDVRNRTGRLINCQGGFPRGTAYATSQIAWPFLPTGFTPTDNDHDGMPDLWETQRGLNPASASDLNLYTSTTGYNNIETYLNGDTLTAPGVLNSCVTAKGIASSNSGNWLHARDTVFGHYNSPSYLVSTDTNNLVASVYDTSLYGNLIVSYYTNSSIRNDQNSKPYLSRNITVVPQVSSTLSGPVTMRLYITKKEYDDLRVADPSITSLSDLRIVNTADITCVSQISPAVSIITPTASGVFGSYRLGYYLEFQTTSFGTFFIRSSNSLIVTPTISSLNCAGVSYNGTATENTAYTASATVPYSGGNGIAYTTGATIASTGVTGLTATIQPGTLANGNGSLTYSISGTPTSAGTANFALSFGGQSCSIALNVNALQPSISSLNCASVSYNATATANTAFSGNATVSYNGGNGAAYTTGTSVSSTGVAGLTATLQPGTLANGNGNLIYSISGTPSSAGTANFALNFGGQSCSILLTVNTLQPSISSLNCGSVNYNATATANTAFSGNATVLYNGGNGAAYSSATPVSSTGVMGLTATLQSGTLANGNGNLIYSISGTPTSAGTANFALSFGGQSCSIALTVNALQPSISSLNCSSVSYNATATANIAFSGNANVPYNGGNGAVYTIWSPVLSTGVTGLTATLQSGTLANGNGNLTYSISGTPTSAGTANFALSFGGQSCSISLTVNALIASITSLSCASVSYNATATANTAFSGSATVPYSGGNGVSYSSGSSVSSTGVTGLTANLQANTLVNGNGDLTYIISGTPTSAGTANFALSFGGQSCSISLTVNPATVNSPSVTSINCGGVGVSSTPIINQSYLSTATLPYTGGNGFAYSTGLPIVSTGVTGLTATLQAGTLANGSGDLLFIISGTPVSAGTANFSINFGGYSCSFGLNVYDTIHIGITNNNLFNFNVVPNPVEGNLLFVKIISPANDQILKSSIYDELGRVLMSGLTTQQLTSDGVDISSLSNGIYFIRLTDKKFNTTLTKKFIKSSGK